MADAKTQAARSGGASWVMAVLEALSQADPDEHPGGLTGAQVARALGRDKSVVSRQLRGLRDAGMISRDDSGRHQLSWRMFAMLNHAGNQRLTTVAKPRLARLTELAQERTYLSVLSGGEVLTVLSQGSRRMIEAANWVGRLVPVPHTSAGIALVIDMSQEDLAAMMRGHDPGFTDSDISQLSARVRRARTRGYAVADRTFNPELLGIGAPIRDITGQVIAALNISGPAGRIRPQITTLAGHLVATTHAVERALYRADPTENARGPECASH